MPWCHTCRVEYRISLDRCPECAGPLTDLPAPERRLPSEVADAGLVVVAMLPPEEALVASGRLEAGGIPAALRDVGNADDVSPVAVEVLVLPSMASDAHAVLSGRRRRRTPWLTYLFLVTAIAVFLSGAVAIARWVLTGRPYP